MLQSKPDAKSGEDKPPAYSDGEQIERDIIDVLKMEPDRCSEKDIRPDLHTSWAFEYHLSSKRSNLLRPFDFEGLDVLEIGGGMGAISRFLAEKSKSLTIVEGSSRRLEAAKIRLRDLDNWKSYCGDFADYKSTEKFDVVTVIGVLEYSEVFFKTKEPNPFAAFLSHAKSFLKENGVLILAIENQLGIKYFSGCVEDHNYKLFSGISGYSSRKQARTFSKEVLDSLFKESGFMHREFFHPWPDYKIPSSIFPEALWQENPQLALRLATIHRPRSYGVETIEYFNSRKVLETLEKAGLAQHFTNSFLVVGSTTETGRGTLRKNSDRKNQIAWHYSSQRNQPIETVFTKFEGGDALVKKKPLATFATENETIKWRPIEEPLYTGRSVLTELEDLAIESNWPAFHTLLLKFLKQSFQKFKLEESDGLKGEAIDALVGNCLRPGYQFFDLEWEYKGEVSKSHFILRNILLLSGKHTSFSSSPFESFKNLYLNLCSELKLPARLEADVEAEAQLQCAVYSGITEERQRLLIEAALNQDLQSVPPYATDPEVEQKARKIVSDLINLDTSDDSLKHLRDILALRERLNHVENEARASREELNQIKNTRSWRVTGPLRKAAHIYKKFLKP